MSRSRRVGRSRAEWIIRLSLAAAAGAVGFTAVLQAAADVALHTGSPRGAYALAPHNGRIMAALSRELMSGSNNPAVFGRAVRLADAALMQDPTAIAAVTTLGFAAAARGRDAQSHRLLVYSQALSRRDLQTQVWAIEDAVAKGDIPTTLHAYDTALRTSKNAAELLFPVLASAMADASIRTGLVDILARSPNWRHAFVEYAAESGPNPQVSAALLRSLAGKHVPVSDRAEATVIAKLVTVNDAQGAWSLYAALRTEADRRRSRDPNFVTHASVPTLFDWTLVGGDGIDASIQKGERFGALEFSLPTAIGGPILQQLQALPPGQYFVAGHSDGVEQPASSLPYWLLTCHGGEELGRVAVSNSVQEKGNFSGLVAVPANCPLQMMTLVARPSDLPNGISGKIDRIMVRPAR